jgi:hypothetical protein
MSWRPVSINLFTNAEMMAAANAALRNQNVIDIMGAFTQQRQSRTLSSPHLDHPAAKARQQEHHHPTALQP